MTKMFYILKGPQVAQVYAFVKTVHLRQSIQQYIQDLWILL